MSVTLEQAHILLQSSMDPSFFQQALDTMRRLVITPGSPGLLTTCYSFILL